MEAAAKACKNLKTVNLNYTSAPPASISLLTAECLELEVLKLAGVRNIVSHRPLFQTIPYRFLDRCHICHDLTPRCRCQFRTHPSEKSSIIKTETYLNIGDQLLSRIITLSCALTPRCLFHTDAEAQGPF